MGIFSASVILKNPAQPERQREVSLLVDTGSLFTWVSAPVLEGIGIQPVETEQLRTTTGALVERRIGYSIVAHDGRSGAMNVVFAEPGDTEVLGVTALETLRVAPDPVQQKLIPVVALAV